MENRKNMQNVWRSKILVTLVAFVLAITLVTPAEAQRRGGGGFGRSSGSFGGGRSFGGGFSRPRSNSSFGGGFSQPRSGGSFGGSRSAPSSSFGSGRSSSSVGSSQRSTSSSFGRSGSMGNSGRVTSTSFNSSYAPSQFRGMSPSYSRNVYVGGSSFSGFGFGFLGGYSLGLLASPWTAYVPFHPGFYARPPIYTNGAYYGGGINWFKVLLGILIIGGIIWFISRLMRSGGGGGNIRYTNYR